MKYCLQLKRRYRINDMYFIGHNNVPTTNLRAAKTYTKEEADIIVQMYPGLYTVWETSELENKAQLIIDKHDL